MADHKVYRARSIIALLLTLAMAIPAVPVLGNPAGETGTAPRAVTDTANDLIIPEGTSYDLAGCHTYKKGVEINGILNIMPWNGGDENTGMLWLSAPNISIGPAGAIRGEGRGYGGGGGGTCTYSSSYAAGHGGTGGTGGNGGNGYSGYSGAGGGGGSNGGKGGTGSYEPAGQDGTDSHGGDGGNPGNGGGSGGTGFGSGGGGGGCYYSGGGGGGGGGTGGKDATWYNGADGGGPYAGKGPNGASWSTPGTNQEGVNGGYRDFKTNGDTSTDLSVWRGSGGSGGATTDYYYGGGAGGGGAGGAAITLLAGEQVEIAGTVLSSGGSGGQGGANYYNTGARGGGGAGGGIAIRGLKVTISGTVDARGRAGTSLSTNNGGTVKLFYGSELTGDSSVQAGRIYKNGRPVMSDLVLPAKDGDTVLRPTFSWEKAVDPEGDTVTYEIQVAGSTSFSPTIIDKSGIKGTQYMSDRDLIGAAFFWRVRAFDAAGPGAWSDTWRFLTDVTPPVSTMKDLPLWTAMTDFTVEWSGTDDSSGIESYTIWVKEGNSTYLPWLNDTPQTAALFSGKDGKRYAFYSIGLDRAHNRELAPIEPDTFTTVDVTPAVSGMIDLARYQSTKRFDVFWGGKDNTSGIAYYDIYVADNNGPFTLWLQQVGLTSGQYEGKEFHTYTFYSIATDKAGNVEPTPGPERMSRTTVDLTSPRTALTMGDPYYGANPTYITPLTPIYLAGTDSGSGLNETTYIIDNRPEKIFHDQLFEVNPGAHNITYWSTDQAGNQEPDTRYSFFVDTDTPVSTVSFNGPNWTVGDKVYISTSTQLVLNSADRSSGLGKIEYNADGRGYTLYTTPLKFDKPGFHSILYRGTDNVGNIEADKTVKIMVDNSPPVTKVTPGAKTSKQTLEISLNATDTDSGVAGVFFRVVRGSEKPGDYATGTAVVIEELDDHSLDGNYTLQYYSVDNVGNTEQTRDIKYKIDTQVLLDVGYTGEPSVSDSTFIIQGKAEPGARVSVNGVPVLVSQDGTFTHQLDLSNGRNKVEFTVTDAAGNTVTKTTYIKYNPPLVGASMVVPLIALVVVVAVVIILAAFMMLRRRKPAAALAPDQRVDAPPAVPPPIPPPETGKH